MSDQRPPLSEERYDELAREAGASLRRPAPDGGADRVRSARRRRQTTRTVVGGAAVAMVVAIGVVAFLPDDPPTAPAVDVTGTDRGGSGPIERLLSQVPMPESIPDVRYYDLRRAAVVADVDVPDPHDPEAVDEWAFGIASVGGDSIVSSLGVVEVWLDDQDDVEAEFGWSLIDIDSGMELLTGSDRRYAVFETALDPAEIEAVVGAPVDGVYRIGSGPDGSPNVEERSAVRPLGFPLNVAVRDGMLAVAARKVDLEWWASDRSDPVADDATLLRMARMLDDAGVLAASLRGRFDGAGTEGRYAATGLANDGETATLVWLTDYADRATAEAATTAQLAALEAVGLTGAVHELDGTFATIRLEIPAGDLVDAQRSIRRSEPFSGGDASG